MAKVLCFGELLLRLATNRSEFIQDQGRLTSNFGGSEVNVAVGLSHLGNDTQFLTALPTDDIGKAARQFLVSHQVSLTQVKSAEGRVGIYFVEMGAGNRASNIIYDRKYSSFAQVSVSKEELSKALDGQDAVFISGITPALSDNLYQTTILLVQLAKKRGITVIYDNNYREKLWSNKQIAFDKLKKLLPMIDVLSVGILDIRAIFQDDSISDLEDAYRRLLSKYPNLKMLFSTNRETISAEEYRLQGSVYTQGKLYQSPKQAIYQVVDRIGTGDSYASSVIHGLLKGETPQNIVDFATANAILKHTVYGDVAIFTESQVKAYMASLPGVINR